jgi:hypothetical protein
MLPLKAVLVGALLAGTALFTTSVLAEDGEETTSGAWKVKQTKSPVDDAPEVTAMNVAPDAGTQFMSNKPGAILLRCKDQKTELAVVTNGLLGVPIGDAGTKVIYRVDSDPAVAGQWHLSADGKGAFYPSSPITFVRSLPAEGRLLIRLYDFQGAYEEAVFSLDGLDSVREAVASACHWPAPQN